jgi:NADH:ubiquinone oxidoreductase subunit D
MPDPHIEEFCRIGGVASCRQDVFRRFQRHLRDTVQDQLDERLRLIEENAALTSRMAELEAGLAKKAAKTKTEAV